MSGRRADQGNMMIGAKFAEPPAIRAGELDGLVARLVPTKLPTGPLDRYRRNASFDWRHMKIFIESPAAVKFENKLFKFLLDDPVFDKPIEEPSLDETRRLSFLRYKRFLRFMTSGENSNSQIVIEPYYCSGLIRCLGMYDWSLYIKYALSSVFSLMTSKQPWQKSIYERIDSEGLIGCIVLTEIAHGSNLRKMETRADYDPTTQEFVLNTPNLEATKCFVGNLGHHATHGLVYAQMYTADGVCHGICTFVVPLRDPITRLPYSGVIVGDMGHKIGLNGIDNGFMQFRNYRLPRESLMNHILDVTPDGQFVSQVKDSNSRFGAALASLSAGRCAIIRMASVSLTKGLVIAVRFSAARRQFGPPSQVEEIPIWEYQLQRWRLLPYLSAAYVLDVYSRYICETYREFSVLMMTTKDTILKSKRTLAVEIHCLTCALKPLSGWIVRDALQEFREACGGHGYLNISGIGAIRNDHDANLTYEGDNNVLLQQTSSFLMTQLTSKRAGRTVESLLHTFDFINDLDDILRGPRARLTATRLEDLLDMQVLMSSYKWLVCFMLTECERRLDEVRANGADNFQAFGDCQPYYLRTLSLVFAEHAVLQHFYFFARSHNLPADISTVLLNLGCLYGLWSLEKHLSLLYQGGFVVGAEPARLLRLAVVHLCEVLKDDAVSLVDVFAPPDRILNSALGAADGRICENIFRSMMDRPGAREVPSWWNELRDFPAERVQSKL